MVDTGWFSENTIQDSIRIPGTNFTVLHQGQSGNHTAMSTLSFDSLPLRKDGTPGNAWGRFGDDDQQGRLNLLTPKVTAEAAKEIVEGSEYQLTDPL